ncbi:MAG TPA: ATPase, T2SS/T4P/T4SS family, partial [Polyangia bacterium]
MPQKRLGQILIAKEGLKPEVLEQALATQAIEGGRIGEVLMKMRAVTEESVLRALGLQLGLAYVADLPFDSLDGEIATKVPIGFEKQHRVLPVRREGEMVLVATADPLDVGALDDVRAQLGAEILVLLAPSQKILDAVNHIYGQRQEKGGDLDETEDDEMAGEAEELVDILDVNDEAPIIRWVNSLLFSSVKERASDIHIEPGEKEVSVRYRIDGVLYEKRRAARQFMPSIIARVKIMAGLNIAEKRLPQDGRIRRKIAGKDIDMRVATAPTVKGGERITIRLLDRENVLHDLADIGFGDDHLRSMDELIHRPHGILLVTGPTGSGKTTTLYACLSRINSPDLNILTIEDPVEYQLDGISQVAVNDKIDLTFATGLRSFLRHDPDVIMVGEI